MWLSVAKFVIWWLIASGLLCLTWNRVLNPLIQVKKAKYWQALLFVMTMAAFCGPLHHMHHHGMMSECRDGGECHRGACDGSGKADGKGDGKVMKEPCPYSKK